MNRETIQPLRTEGEMSETGRLLDEVLARDQIRKWLDEERGSSDGRLWKIVNAPIFVWLMSSIVLSMAVFVVNLASRNLADEKARAETVRRLQVEISYRLDPAVLDALYTSQTKTSVEPSAVLVLCMSPNQLGTDWSNSDSPLQSTSPSIVSELSDRQKQLLLSRFIFQEYQNRSIYSLLWELAHAEKEAEARSLIQKATTAIDQLRNASLSGAPPPEFASPINALTESWRSGGVGA